VSDTDAAPGLRFYFSFSSPFSWLAHHRLERSGALPWNELEPIPVYPPNDETAGRITGGKTRRAYLLEDAERIARAYGFEIHWPESIDTDRVGTDWARPHSAFHWAQSAGGGQAFAGALYRARFLRGEDVVADAALRAAAEAAGLDPGDAVAAAGDPTWRERLLRGFARMQGDRVFGVPTFVLDGERFWGNDRIEWLLRRRAESRGEAVPELAADVLARPC
jgi:2-hydroxychromene-2-carboxylate isomerase